MFNKSVSKTTVRDISEKYRALGEAEKKHKEILEGLKEMKAQDKKDALIFDIRKRLFEYLNNIRYLSNDDLEKKEIVVCVDNMLARITLDFKYADLSLPNLDNDKKDDNI